MGTLACLYGVVVILIGISLMPSMYLFDLFSSWSLVVPTGMGYLLQGISIILGFLAFGLSMIVVVPLSNRLVLPFLKPYRGPYYSLDVFSWYFHNILTYSVRYSFLEWITPTPMNLFFYRMMGMKIGDRTEINTTNISDPGLITLEEAVTIGGSATIIAHYATQGYLVIAPVVIRKNATIGLRAIVMGGVEIGEGAKILPNSVVLPKTVVPLGETWAGVPAQKVILEKD